VADSLDYFSISLLIIATLYEVFLLLLNAVHARHIASNIWKHLVKARCGNVTKDRVPWSWNHGLGHCEQSAQIRTRSYNMESNRSQGNNICMFSTMDIHLAHLKSLHTLHTTTYRKEHNVILFALTKWTYIWKM